MRVIGSEDVLHEHVARVGTDSERESGTRDMAAEHEDGGENAERRDHEKRDNVEADCLIAQRLSDP